MEITAQLINKYVFNASRPGHSCSSCGYDPDDEIKVVGNTLEELRDKVALNLSHRGWNTVKYPSLYTSEFIDYQELSFETERTDKTLSSEELNKFISDVYTSDVYATEVSRIREIMENKKIVTEAERRKAEKERELQVLAELKQKYESKENDNASL